MDKSQAWAEFWRTGSLTSFGDRFSKGYEGEIREYWMKVFREVPQRGVIVDFGAGNGALEEIAHDYARTSKHALTMHAFDLAPELPSKFDTPADEGTHWQLQWHAGSRNEDTGLDARSVDLVVGSYAFEYGDDEKSVAETVRILKPGGRAVFLMHHADSKIITGSQVELAVLDEVLAKDGFLNNVRIYLAEFGNIRHAKQFEKFRKSGKGEPLRQKMNEAHQRAVQHCSTENSVKLMTDTSKWMGELAQPPGLFAEKQELLRRWKEVRQYLEANRARLRDMQLARVDDARRQELVERFVAAGATVEAELFHVSDSEAPIGWMFRVLKGS